MNAHVTVDSDTDWQAAVGPGLDVVIVSYRCPSCRTGRETRLQLPPWSVPQDQAGHDAAAGADGHHAKEFAAYETARIAGDLAHDEVDSITTELWCPACQVGAPATVAV